MTYIYTYFGLVTYLKIKVLKRPCLLGALYLGQNQQAVAKSKPWHDKPK